MTVEECVLKEIELVACFRVANERIAQAEAAAGVAYVDATDSESTAASVDAVLRAKAEVPLIESAIRTVRERRLDAVRVKRQAEAAALRQQSAELRGQIALIEAKVSKHITAINNLQETLVNVSAAVGQPVAKSQRLQTEAMSIESRAAALDGDVPRHGTVDVEDVTSIDPLIMAVLSHESAGPSASDIAEWADAVEERGVDNGSSTYNAHPRRAFGSHSRRFHLVWRDGRIDLAESFIQVAVLARRPAGPVTGALGFEIGSDVFKALSPARGFGVLA